MQKSRHLIQLVLQVEVDPITFSVVNADKYDASKIESLGQHLR